MTFRLPPANFEVLTGNRPDQHIEKRPFCIARRP
jgi:hypothetical protein